MRRVRVFVDEHQWLGPTIWMLSAFYFVAQLVVASTYRPSYSFTSNLISDLGNTRSCPMGSAPVPCSPEHDVMNVAFVALGVVMAAGSLLLYQEFSEGTPLRRRLSVIGFSCIAIAGAGTIVVGVFPENTVHAAHLAGAALGIGVGNLGMLVLSAALRLPTSLRRVMQAGATLSLLALACFASHHDLGIGHGTMERIAAYPETIWLIGFGFYMMHSHSVSRPTTRPS